MSYVAYSSQDGYVAGYPQEAFSSDPVNTAPTLQDYTFSTPENVSVGAVIGTVAGVDDDTLTYSIVSGNTDGDLAINSVTGQITVVNALDYNRTTTYSLTVQVSDGELVGQGMITIDVDRTPGVWIAQPDVVTVWTVL